MEVLPTPIRFGHYAIHAKVGEGGMAQVFLATCLKEELNGRIIAVKKLHPHLSSNKPFVNLLIHEAKVGVLLTHPNIASVYDLGSYRSEFFISMEYVHGRSLDQIARQIKLPPVLGHYIVFEVIRALAFAHDLKDSKNRELNIIHRDLSLGNILISYSGEVKLTDFGIATAEHRLQPIIPQHAIGKIPFMPPEQAINDPAQRSSDIYSLSLVYYILLTGKHPFSITTLDDLWRIPSEPESIAPLLRDKGPKISEPMIQFLSECLAKSPSRRPQTAAEFFHRLRDIIKETEGTDFLLRESRTASKKALSQLLEKKFKKELSAERDLIAEMMRISSISANQELSYRPNYQNSSDATIVDQDLSHNQTVVSPLKISTNTSQLRIDQKLRFSSLGRDHKESLQNLRPSIEIISEEEQDAFEARTLIKTGDLSNSAHTKPGIPLNLPNSKETKQASPKGLHQKNTLVISDLAFQSSLKSRVYKITRSILRIGVVPFAAFLLAFAFWFHFLRANDEVSKSFHPLFPTKQVRILTAAKSLSTTTTTFVNRLQVENPNQPALETFFSNEFLRYTKTNALVVQTIWEPLRTIEISKNLATSLESSIEPEIVVEMIEEARQSEISDDSPHLIILLVESPKPIRPLIHAWKSTVVIRAAIPFQSPQNLHMWMAQGIAFLFGAKSKLEPGSELPRLSDGFAQPELNPLFPQLKADLTALAIPLGPLEKRDPLNLTEVMINEFTARELGWIR